MKGLLRGFGRPAFGHALFRLLQALAETGLVIPPALEEGARLLDAHYIPARYPDAYPEGSPYEYYTPSRAKEALQAARSILGWVEEVWHGLEGP